MTNLSGKLMMVMFSGGGRGTSKHDDNGERERDAETEQSRFDECRMKLSRA